MGNVSYFSTFPASAASAALVTLILYFVLPGKVYYAAPANLMPMLYANTMSAVLNFRFHILGGRAPHISSTVIVGNSDGVQNIGTTSSPIVFNRVSEGREMGSGGHLEMKDVHVRPDSEFRFTMKD
ncbi:hypothetical protein B0H16DRAFT_1727608 [Mycena metata]|uniref:Uncharacterized protein n=1 Tax=Mycena metata TaxID=1033252 RepID=A0AAD7IKP6_9AGAR|nr:hypothetical protein B0H16DRAFT_1727608 [Mycena metata]